MGFVCGYFYVCYLCVGNARLLCMRCCWVWCDLVWAVIAGLLGLIAIGWLVDGLVWVYDGGFGYYSLLLRLVVLVGVLRCWMVVCLLILLCVLILVVWAC